MKRRRSKKSRRDKSAHIKSPTAQYKELLAKKKHASIKSRREEADYDKLIHLGFVLKIALQCYGRFDEPTEEEDGLVVWRRFRVSGCISLNALHDHILLPLMGWSRRYHSYHFWDVHDGSNIGLWGRRMWTICTASCKANSLPTTGCID